VWTEGTKKAWVPPFAGNFGMGKMGVWGASVRRRLLRTCYASTPGLFGACYHLLSPVPERYHVAASH
ncbi:MAG: hypothetical protein ACHP84_03655, partial [Caulobacterales bacterium]